MPHAKKNQLVGLDIGSHSIKLVELDRNKRGRLLKNFGLIVLPPGVIVEGSIKEMGLVSSAVRNLFRNLKVRNRNVATSISGYAVIAKRIALSKREETEIEATIKEEAEEYIPFDINEVNIDFDILSSKKEFYEDEPVKAIPPGREKETSEEMDIMLVAAKKDIVDDHVSLLRSANLNPGVLDVDTFALQNAVELNAEEPRGCFGIVNIGAQELGINVVKNGISMFSRDTSYGGNHITQAIMSEFRVSFEEAEKIKLGGVQAGNRKEGLERIFAFEVSSWVREIGRALDFVSHTYPEDTIEKIYVSGGSCRINGLQKYLQSELGMPVEELNPFRNIIINGTLFDHNYLDHMAPQAGVAVGLALRSIGDK